ncbi:MAG: BamA/TamA family outer membrane protein [Saprospiraceae bacterium]|nr:BamA/TamA family outer membrane protein [Saprospiraceae bacterium]
MRHFCLLVFFILSAPALRSQPDTLSRPGILALPIVFYSPDTRWGFGASGILTFQTDRKLPGRRSSITFGGAYTQFRQILFYAPFQLYFNQDRWWLYGELGYYRYVYNFFGIGNAAPKDYLEKYDATYPRLRLSALRKVGRYSYLGLRYAFDDVNIVLRDSTAQLATEGITGAGGGRVSGVGMLYNFDSRDQLFFPAKGWLVEILAYAEGPTTGSNFTYSRFSADAARYFPVFKKHVLALNAVAVLTTGDPPFHQLATLGGTRRLRGYFDGRFRDKRLLLLQGEYRLPLFWRIGAVAFGGAGWVGSENEPVRQAFLRWNVGAGLRFALDRRQKINLRLDYGVGKEESGFYLTVGEAF